MSEGHPLGRTPCGLIHYHAIFRLYGHDPSHPERTVPPPHAITADVLAGVIRTVASSTWFATVSHPARPKGWDITWGTQIDPRVVRLTDDGQITDIAVASYLAKYATKSTEPVGVPPARITADTARLYAMPRTHHERLIAASFKLGAHSHQDFRALRLWAHMLGYRGHFATKSRRYSTTMRALRVARRDWQRRQHPQGAQHGDKTVFTHTDLHWAGRGWRNTGDALLALSAAARAREHRCVAREEAFAALRLNNRGLDDEHDNLGDLDGTIVLVHKTKSYAGTDYRRFACSDLAFVSADRTRPPRGRGPMSCQLLKEVMPHETQ